MASIDTRNPLETIETILPARSGKPVRKRAVYYPTGDGKPMAEDNLHRKLMAYGCDALEFHFAPRRDVYVSGNDFVYYEKDNARARVSPDCYVAFGIVSKAHRPSYKVWEENDIPPSVVFEFTSKATQKDDIETKRPLYEQRLRVAEYFQFDPTGDYLHPRLQGQRLQGGKYQSIELRDNRMFSEQLQLELVVQDESLHFYDPIRGEWLRTYAEAEAQRREAAIRRQEAESRQQDAEAQQRAAELRAGEEAQRAAEADGRAEVEAQRAQAAEAQLAQLRAEMEALRRQQ